MALHTRILLGLVLGAAAGIAMNLAAGDAPATRQVVRLVTEPAGRIWLNALIMVVIPLIVSTVSLGVVGLGSVRQLGRIGVLTLASFLSLTALATVLGLVAVNVVRPGDGLPVETRTELMAAFKDQSTGAMGLAKGALGVNTFVSMVPRNPVKAAADGEMLAVIVFAIMLGVALTTSVVDSIVADNQRALSELAEAKRRVTTIGQVLLKTGDPRDVINQAALDLHADLIVMGTHGRRGVTRALLGSVAESVVRSAPCPVLTVRAPKGKHEGKHAA